MYSASFYGVPVHRSRTIVFIYRQADPSGVTYLWYSRGLSSPPYTDTGMSHQCSDRCPHSYTASSWYTRSHLQFKNLSGTKFGSVCYISFKNCLINVFCINCFIVIHLFPSTVQQKKKKPWAVLNVALYAISISSIIWLMCIDKKN